MNNDPPDDDHNARALPFSHAFSIGTTIQNVFRNINHAFSGAHDGQQRDLRHHAPPPNAADGRPDAAHASTNADMPSHPQFDSHDDEDQDSMPDLRSVADSSDEDEPDGGPPPPPSEEVLILDDDHSEVWIDDGQTFLPPPPMTGTRRARVDDDGDDARDRRHPSERVGGPLPGDAVPQQPPRPPGGLFSALFGLSAPGGGTAHEHAPTGEGAAGDHPATGQPLRGVPILAGGFTFSIPLFGPPPAGARTEPAAGGQGGPPGMFGMDAASREELFASFAAFFQEFHALDEGREDPERAKKLVAGLEVVPLGLVKRLERIGGAPGGHIGESGAERSSSGCAICWDTLLDAEGDSFSGRPFSGQVPPPSVPGTDTVYGHDETEGGAMDIDAHSVPASHSEPGTPAPASPFSDTVKIISLPCAHVFHASCLLPWFTRAKQATCPTCRFNIDPENLTYTPLPRRVFTRAPPAQAAPNPAPADGQTAPGDSSDGPGVDVPNAAVPPVDPVRAGTDARPSTPGPIPPPPPPGQPGVPPAGLGFNPFFAVPGIPILSMPAIQIPLRPNGTQAPGGGNQGTLFTTTAPRFAQSLPSSTNEYSFASAGMDVVTIGLDMFIGGPPPEEGGGEPRGNAERADVDNGGASAGAAGGNGAANPNGFTQDIQSLIEGLVRTTRNIIPQVINAQGPAPAPAPGAVPAEGPLPPSQPQPGPQAIPVPGGGPRIIPILPFHPNMFRPTRPMPPRRERKTWTLPPAPGPSLRQRVEQQEREQGLRCSDTSCGIGPSDDDPCPEPSTMLTKQVSIRRSSDARDHGHDARTPVCAHAFHPGCLVSAQRVAGWGGEDKTEPFVEVSCPTCRAVGCVTREEWESGVSAL